MARLGRLNDQAAGKPTARNRRKAVRGGMRSSVVMGGRPEVNRSKRGQGEACRKVGGGPNRC